MIKNIKLISGFGFQIIVFCFLVSGCIGKQAIKTIFKDRTPYETYEHNLREAKLHRSALGQDWVAAGQKALRDTTLVTLPFQATGYFRSEKPSAACYSFKALQGELIDIKVTTRAKQDLKLFLDLYEVGSDIPRQTKHLAAADTTSLQLEYKVEENLIHLVRLQPELLRSGSFTITIVVRPSLGFPVQGKDNKAVQSFWGADRDNGTRKHEGVDIFAPRGTPVVAVAKGTVSRVDETPIGGKVIWLSDLNERQNIYYAHLDKQLVQLGQQVNPGDVLGLVGNTGNARSTVPHLHFGVYAFGQGAVDPYPFIKANNITPAPLRITETLLGQWARASKNRVNIRTAPSSKGFPLTTLSKHSAFQVIGGAADWYQLLLPDGKIGYIQKENLELTTKPIKIENLKVDTEILEEPELTGSPIALIKKNTSVPVLGIYQIYKLVKIPNGTLGWLK